MIPLIWLAAGVVLLLAEVLTGTLVLLMLGGAAVITAGASALGVPFGADVVVFAVAAAAGVLLARPALTRRLRPGADEVNTGTRALLGTAGEVVDPITPGHPGTVRLDGAVWTARTLHDDAVDAGTSVVVVQIAGATAVVAVRSTLTEPPEEG